MENRKPVKNTKQVTPVTAPKEAKKVKKPKPQIEEFTLPIKKRKIFKKKAPKIRTIFGYRTGQKVQMNEKGKPIIPFKRKIANIIKGRKYDKDGVEVQETLKSRLIKFAKKRGKKTVKKQFKKQIKNWWGSLQGVSKVAVISIGGVGITAAVAVPTVLANTIWKADNYKVQLDDSGNNILCKELEKDANGNLRFELSAKDATDVDITGVAGVKKGDYPLVRDDSQTEFSKGVHEYTFNLSSKELIVDKNVIGTHKGDLVIKPSYDFKTKSITISGLPESGKIINGGSFQLSAKILPAHATHKEVDWVVTQDDTYITVDESGKVTADNAKKGTATIQAKLKKDQTIVSNEITVEVVDTIPITEITIVGSDKLMLNKAISYTANIKPRDATIQTLTWNSSNTDVATVDSNGLVTSKAVGTTTITATATDTSGKVGSLAVTVTEETVLEPVGEKNGILYEAIQGTNECIISKGTATKLTKLIVNDTTEHVGDKDVNVVGIKEGGFMNSPDLVEVQLNSNRISTIGAGAFVNCPKLTSITFSEDGLGVSSWKISYGTDKKYWGPDISSEHSGSSNLAALTGKYKNYTFENTKEFYFTHEEDAMGHNLGIVSFNGVLSGTLSIPSCFYIGEEEIPYISDSIANKKNRNLANLAKLEIPFSVREIKSGALSTISESFTSATFALNTNWRAEGVEDPLDFSTPESTAASIVSNKTKRIYIGLSDLSDTSVAYDWQSTSALNVKCANGASPAFIYLPECVNHPLYEMSDVRAIGDFSQNTSLTTFVISASVNRTVFNTKCFENCTNLGNVYFRGSKSRWESWSADRTTGWHGGCPFTTVHCIDGDAAA